MTRRWVVLAVLVPCAVACGSSEPPPKTPDEAPEPQAVKPIPLKMKSELGQVDPAAVTRAFHTLDDKFDACQKRGLARVEVLAGKLGFFLRIGDDGSARWAYLEQSDVGDRPTEKCLLDAVLAARWPRPDGGDAEAHYTMELPAQGRPATDWNTDRLSTALAKAADGLDECKGGGSGTFRATVYVGPGGHVLSAGVSASTREAAAKVDCLAKVLEKMKGLPSPGSWPAKVSFAL